MAKQLMKTGEPYYYPGDEIGCLLIHGFTATPKEMSYLAQHLKEEGHTVVGVRLAGHATKVQDMARMHYQDWLASVEDGYHMLKQNCEKIIVIGLSMGGVLALTFSSINQVAGVIAMSTPYRLRSNPKLDTIRIYLLKFLSYFKSFYKKGPSIWFHSERLKDRISYDQNPLASAAELIKLLKHLRTQLPKIDIPALIIHSIDDDFIVSENAELIYEALTTKDKELVYVEQAAHVITEDGDLELLFSKVSAFINRIIKE